MVGKAKRGGTGSNREHDGEPSNCNKVYLKIMHTETKVYPTKMHHLKRCVSFVCSFYAVSNS